MPDLRVAVAGLGALLVPAAFGTLALTHLGVLGLLLGSTITAVLLVAVFWCWSLAFLSAP